MEKFQFDDTILSEDVTFSRAMREIDMNTEYVHRRKELQIMSLLTTTDSDKVLFSALQDENFNTKQLTSAVIGVHNFLWEANEDIVTEIISGDE